MRIYDVDFDRWVAIMLPTMFRRRRLYALCRAMCAPVQWLYRKFLASRKVHLYKLRYNGQVCHLRAALNEAFGISSGFEITDADGDLGEWIFVFDEAIDTRLYAFDAEKAGEGTVVYDSNLLKTPYSRFAVRVPGALYDERLEEIKAIVDRFRLPAKTPIYIRKPD